LQGASCAHSRRSGGIVGLVWRCLWSVVGFEEGQTSLGLPCKDWRDNVESM
jgi:hypothetical protein